MQHIKENPSTKRVLVCGVSYKPNVSDTRDAPQEHFIKALLDNGIQVDVYDPLVNDFMDLEKVDKLSKTALGYDYDHTFVMHKHRVCAEELESLRGLENVKFFC